MSSFKSNENIHKKEDGSYYVVSDNKVCFLLFVFFFFVFFFFSEMGFKTFELIAFE